MDPMESQADRWAGRGSEPVPKPLFVYQPEPSFTHTFGWMLCALPAIGAVSAIFDIVRGGRTVAALMTLGGSGLLFAALFAFSLVVDRAQARIRLEVLPDGTLRFRNVAGRTRTIPLRGGTEFKVRVLKSAPKTTLGGHDTEPRDRRLSQLSPHFVEIRVHDTDGRRHKVILSGTTPRSSLRDLHNAVREFVAPE